MPRQGQTNSMERRLKIWKGAKTVFRGTRCVGSKEFWRREASVRLMAFAGLLVAFAGTVGVHAWQTIDQVL